MDVQAFDTDPQPDGASRDDRALVVIGGHPPDRRILGHLPDSTTVICADSGLDHALRLGLEPTAVIGDMDSVSGASLELARSMGCAVIEHPADKDLTDTELALAHAVDIGCRHITVVWGGGDRIDHVLGVIAALGHPRLADLDSLTAWLAADRLDILHPGRELVVDHRPETLISLLAIGSLESVVSTSGLKWDLDDASLSSRSARGVSNVVMSRPCRIVSRRGVIAVVTPGWLEMSTEPSRLTSKAETAS